MSATRPATPPARERRPGIDIVGATKPMWTVFFVFLIPLMLSNVLQALSSTLNSIFLGRLIGVDALAAVSALFPVIFFLISFLIGLSNGSTVLIGQAFGAGDEHAVKKVAATVLTLSLLLGIAAAAIGALFTNSLLVFLGTPSNILKDSEAYARIMFLALPIFFVYLTYTTVLRGTGDSQTPFYFLILTTVLGVVATPALIRGWIGLPQIGVVSPAVAAIFANLCSLAALIAYLRSIRHALAPDREMVRDLGIDWGITRNIVKIGVPTGIQVVMVSLSEIAVISFVNRFGSHATAAYGAVNQVVSYVQFPAISIGITGSIFGAQCIGARREDKLGSVIRSGVHLNYAIGGVLIVLCYAFSWS
ncbi:MAG: MATE family efflux transporter, partial [Candidatus Eremiobacteraeota bacterium]|nr:MATE family efflux transporter [Candidatus Eremiobacteraeota bacterium]